MAVKIVLAALSRELKIPIEAIDADQNLKELPDLDSLRLLRVISSVEDELGVGVDDDLLYSAQTVRQLAEMFIVPPDDRHPVVLQEES